MEYPYSLDDYVKDLVTFMRENSIVKPHVVAHSFGARVALKASYTYPDLFDKMVLTGAAGLKPRFSIKKQIRKTAFKFCKIFLPKEKLLRFYSKDYLELDSVMRKSFVKIVNERLDGVLSSITNDTLLVFGQKDKETPLYMAKRLRKGINKSRLVVIKDAGHFAFLDKSIKFNVETREFLLSGE